MALFLTSYATNGSTYGSYIEADDFAAARTVALARGIGEHVDGEIEAPALANQLVRLLSEEKWIDAAHEASFLCFVGIASGALSPLEVLGDAGLVHEILHLARDRGDHPDEDPRIVKENAAERRTLIARVKSMAREFEYRVPGWHRSYTGQPGVRTVMRRMA